MSIISIRYTEEQYHYYASRCPEAVLESIKEGLIEKIKDIPARDLVSFRQGNIELDVRIFNDKEDKK